MTLKKHSIISLLSLVLFLISCDDDFLNRGPLTALSPETFFKTKRDLQIYTNGFYRSMPVHSGYTGGTFDDDDNSDNQLPGSYRRSATYSTRLNGETVVPSSGGGYSWGNVRNVNYFLSKLSNDMKASTDSDIKHYIGEAYFFRAWYYFSLLKSFGDLPWIDKPLRATLKETALERISRKTIVENMVKDLDLAIAKLKDGAAGDSDRINKYVALALKARICLYEGTWEKYHSGTPFGVTGANGANFITLAKEASGQIISSGRYEIVKGPKGNEYVDLFNKTNYSGNKEVLFWGKRDLDKGLTHNINRYMHRGNGPQITKQFVDACLMKNGKLPTVANGYAGETGNFQVNLTDAKGDPVTYNDAAGNTVNLKVTYNNTLKDRDPRLVQSVFSLGSLSHVGELGVSDRILSTLNIHVSNKYTGYPMRKGANTDNSQHHAGNIGTMGNIIFRYAEVLLIYAEAVAELGENAEAIAKIDLLRDRVGMTKLSVQMPAGSDVLKEVRRERRIELLAEGTRMDDIYRWKAASTYIINKKPLGIKWTGNAWIEGMYDGTFKPVVDVQGTLATNAIPKYAPTDYLSNGFLSPYEKDIPTGYNFDEGRDYLRPINKQDILLSEGKLNQNPGYPTD